MPMPALLLTIARLSTGIPVKGQVCLARKISFRKLLVEAELLRCGNIIDGCICLVEGKHLVLLALNIDLDGDGGTVVALSI